MKMQLKQQVLQRSKVAMPQKRSELPDAPVFKSKNRQIKAKTEHAFSNKDRSNNRKQKIQKKEKDLTSKTKKLLAGGILLSGLIIYYIFKPPATDAMSWNYKKHQNYASTKIELSAMDLDQKVLDHLKNGTIPPEYKNIPYYYKRKIAKGDIKIYSITVLDNCAEDGDIVRIKVNRMDLGEVLLTNAGSTISVPLSASGNDNISIIGVKDGQGGITVTFRTSQGDYYSKVMQPGEVYNMQCGVN